MRFLLVPLALLFLGCPTQNSAPCDTDDQCPANKRCRRGACGPICLSDTDCGTGQVCASDGTCQLPPECKHDTDCAQGFECTNNKCTCTADSACAANQQCENGICTTRKPCTGDADCAGTGQRCEITSGTCLPTCILPADCAPNLNPNVATALYTCVQGTCTRRCVNDVSCGTSGFICEAGDCTLAECKTLADCPSGQYCTDPNFGRCLDYTPCTDSSMCPKNFECKHFSNTMQCPPGFDCTKSLCQELPTCAIDGDCVSGVRFDGGTPGSVQTGYCEEGHCQSSPACTGPSCPSGFACINDLCVPAVCRGSQDCPGQACVDGACQTAPAAGDINQLAMVPSKGLLEAGDTLKFTLIAFKLDGSSFPMGSGNFQVTDLAGSPTTAATIDANGTLTAVSAATVKVIGSVNGANVPPQNATVIIYDHVTAGRRVLVLDAATRQPLTGVKVYGCPTGCTTPDEVDTDATGAAAFPAYGSGTVTFSAVSQDVRGDGLPTYERVSVLETHATDVMIALRVNPVHEASGFNGSVSFSNVHTTGQYWAGMIATGLSDVPELDLQSLLGEQFNVDIPGIGQTVPVPGAVVLYTSPGFGIPQSIKSKSLGLGQPGLHHSIAFAGRGNLNQVTALRSTQFLSYVGAFDYALQPWVSMPALARVPDTTDVNNNGLCTDTQQCPMGTEDVPDYAHFPMLNLAPQRQQKERTEVILPKLPSTLDTVVVSVTQISPDTGMLPLGFSSVAAGAPGNDGTRPVPNVVLQSGSPYGGVEVGLPALWALAGSAAGNQQSGRLVRGDPLPESVSVAPFLPAASGSSWSATMRSFIPGQPDWASVYSNGADVARVSITGSEARHTILLRRRPPADGGGLPGAHRPRHGPRVGGECEPGGVCARPELLRRAGRAGVAQRPQPGRHHLQPRRLLTVHTLKRAVRFEALGTITNLK
ncbi:MAG: hypothetical protein QM723_39695 [Myxococcaceae bacterium]